MNKKWMDTVNHHFIVPVATWLQQTSIWHQLINSKTPIGWTPWWITSRDIFQFLGSGIPNYINDSIFATIASWVGTVDSKPQIHKLLTKLASFLLVSLVGWTLMSAFLQQIRPNEHPGPNWPSSFQARLKLISNAEAPTENGPLWSVAWVKKGS